MDLFSKDPNIFLGGQLNKKQQVFHTFDYGINRLPFLCLILLTIAVNKLSITDLPLHELLDLTNRKFLADFVQKPALAKQTDIEGAFHDCAHHRYHGLLWEYLGREQRAVEGTWAHDL